MRTKSRMVSRAQRLCAATASVFLFHSFAFAGVTINSSSVKWTFDPDTSGGTDLKTLNLAAPASSAMPVGPSYQLSQTFNKNNSSSTAKGSIGYVVNPTTATFTLSPGTGVTQNDPGNANYPGNSSLRVDFDGLFTATTPSFGPAATGYVSVAVGGTVGAGGSAGFTGQVQFLNTNGTALRSTVNFSQNYTTAGPFAQTFTSSGLLNPLSIATNTQFRVKGFFEFRASNTFSPTDILPFDIDVGGAPPTATWYANSNGNWNDPANWTPPPGSVIDLPDLESEFSESFSSPAMPEVPNAIGQRARFANYINADRIITLDDDITLGALDVGSAGNLKFTSTSGKKIILDTEGDDSASIHTRNLNGNKISTIEVPVILNDSAEVDADGGSDPNSATSIIFKQQISGAGKSLNKKGGGKAQLDSANTYTGGTTVENGELNANVTGALGDGSVKAKGGKLNYNAAHAAKLGVPVVAEDGGEINLNIIAQSNEKFVVNANGAISGSAAELEALDSGTGGNLQLTNGALIGHETFDTGAKGSPKKLGEAKYIFGVATNFVDPKGKYIISVGSESKTFWSGFGSSGGDRTFGASPTSANDKIQLKGNADLEVLNGTLRLNAIVQSTDNNVLINKTGKGVLELNNTKNDVKAPVNVKEGSLFVNGALRAGGVVVKSGATLGGSGTVDAPVTIESGGILSPGTNTDGQRLATLHTGALTLASGSELDFDLGGLTLTGAPLNDLVDVKGKLTLDGTLNIFDAGNFGPGTYTLFGYSGTLANFGLDIGSTPNDALTYSIAVTTTAVVLNVGPQSLAAFLGAEAIPEPASFASIMVLGSSLLMRRKRV